MFARDEREVEARLRNASSAARSIELKAELLHREQSQFQLIEFRQHPLYGTQLFLDNDLQISSSDSAYNTAMVSPLYGISPLTHAVILGGGDGGVLGELLRTTQLTRSEDVLIELVDIDQRVVELSKQHFPEFGWTEISNSSARIVIEDAFDYISRQRGLDAVIYDLTIDPIRHDQSQAEFINEIVDKIALSLRFGGVLSMQCCSGPDLSNQNSVNKQLISEIIKATQRNFIDIRMQRVLIPSYEEMWIFLSARKELIV